MRDGECGQREVCNEPVADITVRYAGRLKGATIGGDDIAGGIDEIPILALASSVCDGTFSVRSARELPAASEPQVEVPVGNGKPAEPGDGIEREA